MIDSQNDSPRGLRNKILLLMGYKTKRQQAEIFGFEFSDLTSLLNKKLALRLRFSKDEQYGEGKLIGIYRDWDEFIAT